ncbi:MAG TPA: thiamine pyrophosphate-binding protein, partial [Actinomycetota bacterium]|nr:thiamine pyrophosphate-binding protein [Actinomycetota bacterium]
MRAADVIVSLLEEAGVTAAFGIPGVHNLALFDALSRSSVRTVVTRHEGAAAHAADGYARATGRIGVVVTTTGPGAANATAGIGEAWAAGSPVLHLTTQVPLADVEAGVQRGILHQSPGQLERFRSLTGWADRARSPAAAVRLVAAALRAHEGARPSPRHVEVPFDLLDEDAELLDGDAEPDSRTLAGSQLPPPGPEEYASAAAVLGAARSPVVWAGGGVVAGGAFDELARVAERLAAPVVTTYLGRTAIPASHPLAVAISPPEPAVRGLLAEADALLAVGTDFGATVTMGGRLQLPDRIVRVDIDPGELAKHGATVALRADALEALAALDGALAAAAVDRSEEVPHVAARVAALRAGVRRAIADDPRTAEAAAFLIALESALPPEAIVVCDMCVAGYWCGGYLPRERPRSLLYPLGWGTLGFGLPAAVGAAAAGVGPVLAVVGDAGFLYYPGELATAVEQGLDLVVLVVNDGGYG